MINTATKHAYRFVSETVIFIQITRITGLLRRKRIKSVGYVRRVTNIVTALNMDGSRLIEFLIITISAWSALTENVRCSRNGIPEPSFGYYVDDVGSIQRLNKSINPRYYGHFGYVDATQSPILKANTYASEKSAATNNKRNSDYLVSDSHAAHGKTYYNPLYHVFGVAPNNNNNNNNNDNNDKASPITYYPEIYPHHQQVPVSPYWPDTNSFDHPYNFYYDEMSEEFFPEDKEQDLVTPNNEGGDIPLEVTERSHIAPLFKSFVLSTERSTAKKEHVNASRAVEKKMVVAAENFASNTTRMKNVKDNKIHHASTTSLPDVRIVSEKEETTKQKAVEDAQRVIDYLIDLGTKRRKIPLRHQVMKIPHLRNTTRHRSRVPLSLSLKNKNFNRLDDNIMNSSANFNEI